MQADSSCWQQLVSTRRVRAAHGALLPSSGHPVGGRQPQLRAAIRTATPQPSRTAASSQLSPCSQSLRVPASCSPALWTLISLWNETPTYSTRQGPPGWSRLPGKCDRRVRWGSVHAGEEGRAGFLYYAGTIFYLFADKKWCKPLLIAVSSYRNTFQKKVTTVLAM